MPHFLDLSENQVLKHDSGDQRLDCMSFLWFGVKGGVV